MYKLLLALLLAYPVNANNTSIEWKYVQQAHKIEKGKRNTKVAVIDTGIDYAHPKLNQNILPGWDFISNNSNAHDWYDHGTHVSGIILKIANVSIIPIRYYSSLNTGLENLKYSTISMNYAVKKKVNIVNYSSGGPKFSKVPSEVIDVTTIIFCS